MLVNRLFFRFGFRCCDLVLLAFFASMFTSCSDEVSLVYPGEAIPVIYGIFDASDTAHSIKVTKSFSGEEDAMKLMQNPGNLYYNSPEISLAQTGSNLDIQFLESPSHRNEGVFPESPNPVYSLKRILPAGLYTIRITLPGVEKPIISETELFKDLKIIYPNSQAKRIYFYEDPLTFSWFPSENAASYEIAFKLVFEELTEDGESSNRKVQYSRHIQKNELRWERDRYQFQIYSDPVYAFLGTRIPNNKSISYRKPLELIASITAADEELTTYLKEMHPASDIKKDPKGNIDGAIGVIASKFTVRFNHLKLSYKAMDSLRTGRFTKNLKFVSNPDW